MAQVVRRMLLAGVQCVDGMFPVFTKEPCVDGVTVKQARTKLQRKMAAIAWKRRQFCGWVSLEDLQRFLPEGESFKVPAAGEKAVATA